MVKNLLVTIVITTLWQNIKQFVLQYRLCCIEIQAGILCEQGRMHVDS